MIKYTEIDTEKQRELESIFKNEKNIADEDNNTGNDDDENIYEKYDENIYEEYIYDENIYEEYIYDENIYEEYSQRYQNFPQTPETNSAMISRLKKNKWVILLVISLLSIAGIAVSLSVHSMTPDPLQSTATSLGILSFTIITLFNEFLKNFTMTSYRPKMVITRINDLKLVESNSSWSLKL